MSTIEFELILVHNAIHFPEDEPVGLLGFNEQNISNLVEENKHELVKEDNVEPNEDNNEEGNAEPIEENNEEDNADLVEEISEEDNAELVEETSEEDDDYKVDAESVVDSDPDGNEAAIVVSSDEETALTRVARYCQNHQWAPNPNGTISLENGQVIGNVKFTREVIKKYAIQERFTLKKIKNDRYRYTVTCKNDACDWRLHASCLTDKITFMIKSVRGSHSICPRVAENKEATSRAKRIVLETLKIHHVEAYAKLKKYDNAMRTMNQGTDVKLAMNPEVQSDNPTFMRFYLSFNACKSGFLNGYRPLIGVDGCHLSGQFGGVLLSATTLDGDNNIVPIAICICEFETSESWTWFLSELRDSLGWDNSRRICFISDRQKGCLQALKKEWPNAYSRYCFRHIVANFMATFKNHKINWKLWQLARVANRVGFNQALASIREESLQATNWLMSEPVEKWARHAFEPSIKADHISNNMSECF
ncbi:hypothetical protein EZV62_001567 [Acer yangbiense]|uniref:MULE transposase domain-containing protein n=1 Tax=Acer yangbiense TaxID=1000413 RepID=A0A5C7IV83_9ROSI|nr:hypothetical protein EZV62_001567 [Acer yangbiense]